MVSWRARYRVTAVVVWSVSSNNVLYVSAVRIGLVGYLHRLEWLPYSQAFAWLKSTVLRYEDRMGMSYALALIAFGRTDLSAALRLSTSLVAGMRA